MNTEFFKQYGAAERQDSLVKLSSKNYVVFYGFGKDQSDAETGFNYRKNYDHKPSIEEIHADIINLIDHNTDQAILSGFSWSGKPVYLSSENQFNFKAAYDLCVQTEGKNLPIKFKLGEDEEGKVVYNTFTTISAFTDFYTKTIAYINTTLNNGWSEKDSIDLTKYEI